MRAFVLCLLLLGATAPVLAQEQERSLVDRLLKPDMTLTNDAQGKQFTGVRRTVARNATTRDFTGVRALSAKEFTGRRTFFARLFGRTRDYPGARSVSLTSRSDVPQKTFATHNPQLRESPDAEKSVATSGYAGERPFVAQGKSQKSLDAQRHQMSIDEVRELLNRNK